MVESDHELRQDARAFLGYGEATLSVSELENSIRRAKRYITSRKRSLDAPDKVDWYAAEEPQSEALFWYTCLYAKITAGEFDAPSGSVGNISTTHLAAEDTEIYTNAQESLDRIDVGGRYGITTVDRDGRGYEYDSGGV